MSHRVQIAVVSIVFAAIAYPAFAHKKDAGESMSGAAGAGSRATRVVEGTHKMVETKQSKNVVAGAGRSASDEQKSTWKSGAQSAEPINAR